jgi:hypothetical protein
MTLTDFLWYEENPLPEDVQGRYIVFNKQVADHIEASNTGKFLLMPTRIDDDTYFLTADCLLEKEGIYKYVIQDMPMDEMQVVDEQEWLPYQAIITAQQQEEEG